MTVTVFTNPSNPQCEATEQELAKLGVRYDEIAIAPAMANFLGPLVTGPLIDNAGPQPAMELAVDSSLPSTHSMSARFDRREVVSKATSVSRMSSARAVRASEVGMPAA